MRNNQIASLTFSALFLNACQEYKDQRALFSQAEAFSHRSVFHVFVDFPDEIHSGNAFLVEKDTLLTAAHIFDQPAGQNIILPVYIRVGRGFTPARIEHINRYRDIAVLSAAIPGEPLELRNVRESDEHAFVAGFLPAESNTATLSSFQIISARVLTTSLQSLNKITNPRLMAETKLTRGLSGSPLIGLDGRVIGMFVVYMLTGQPMAEFVDVRHLRESLDLYNYIKKRKNRAVQDLSQSKSPKDIKK